MSSQGPLGPGTGADDASVGTQSWTNPGNVTAEDGVAATIATLSATSHYLKATNFGFTIPAGATINGILLEVKRSQQNVGPTLTDNSVKLVKSSGAFSANDNADTATNWPTVLAYASYGSSSDLWGESWAAGSGNDVNSSNFGGVVSCKKVAGGATGPNIDYMRITITYTAAGGGGAQVAVSRQAPLWMDSTRYSMPEPVEVASLLYPQPPPSQPIPQLLKAPPVFRGPEFYTLPRPVQVAGLAFGITPPPTPPPIRWFIKY